MTAPPSVLTIAGSDPSGGAGLQADLKTFAALGCHGTAVVAALTAQSTEGVTGVQACDAAFVGECLRTLFADALPRAAKTGMLCSAAVAREVAARIAEAKGFALIVDPVLAAGSGQSLARADLIEALRTAVIPAAVCVTPNVDEAAALSGRTVRSMADLLDAGRAILDLGCRSVLLKGGHLVQPGDRNVTDVLLAPGAEVARWTRPKLELGRAHGTGCALSAALAAFLARGFPLVVAVGKAGDFVHAAIEASFQPGRGARVLGHAAAGVRSAIVQ